MKKLAAVAIALSATFAGALPSQAQSGIDYSDRIRVINNYCERYPDLEDCWGYNQGSWSRNDYNRFYDRRRTELDGIAAGVLGLAVGAIIGGAIANSNNNSGGGDRLIGPVGGDVNVAACQARYRSYDVETNTFLGYDGIRKPCTL
jgi:hypothetical protein